MFINTFTVGMFQTNCYVIADEKTGYCAIIDPGEVSEEVDNCIEDNHYTVKYIIFTHGHFDHIGGLYHYFVKYSPEVLIHKADSASLTDEHANFTYPAPYKFMPVKPTVLLDDGDIIELGGSKIEVIHTPGHTPGGISLYSDGVLFSGDTLFYRSVGRTDFNGGSYSELEKSILKLYKLPDSTEVYPGHGIKTNLSEEKFENPFVRL